MAMKPIDAFTDFSSVSLPPRETDVSRRYLDVITRWIPVGMSYFSDWPIRPNCPFASTHAPAGGFRSPGAFRARQRLT